MSTWLATSAGTSSLAMLTKLTSFGSILAARSTLRLRMSAKPPGSWMPMRLPLRSAIVLMSARTTIEASNFGRLADSAFTVGAV